MQFLEHTSEKACVKEMDYLRVLGNPAPPKVAKAVHLFPKEVEAPLAYGYREDNRDIEHRDIEQRDEGYYRAGDQEQSCQAWIDPVSMGITPGLNLTWVIPGTKVSSPS
ncbi:MAG TPA: hypothetical protein VHF46_02040 [Rubrobacteraceae bacterium]|nr:hypothetical protein [Rubrobacteraceae bacterium]